eukprot:c3293_g1_i1 orf=2-370(-)
MVVASSYCSSSSSSTILCLLLLRPPQLRIRNIAASIAMGFLYAIPSVRRYTSALSPQFGDNASYIAFYDVTPMCDHPSSTKLLYHNTPSLFLKLHLVSLTCIGVTVALQHPTSPTHPVSLSAR